MKGTPTITGKKLGRYEIRSKIGAGGMGEVYLARDTKLDRKVALKILPPDVAASQERMRRFVQEAKAASALNHPNIITIHEIDQTEFGHFIAAEFIEGETLRRRIRSARLRADPRFGDTVRPQAVRSSGVAARDSGRYLGEASFDGSENGRHRRLQRSLCQIGYKGLFTERTPLVGEMDPGRE
jgi:hypothetical protein